MLTPEERFWIGMKTLERLRPTLKARKEQERLARELERAKPDHAPEDSEAEEQPRKNGSTQGVQLESPADSGTSTGEFFQSGEATGRAPERVATEDQDGERFFLQVIREDLLPYRKSDPQETIIALDGRELVSYESPSLAKVLAESGPFPAQTVLLGLCEDELPFTLDLTDPAPGAILIGADAGTGKSRLLHSLLASLVQLNSPGQVSYHLVASNLEEYTSGCETPHCLQAVEPSDPTAREVVLSLANVVEQRRHGSQRGPAFLLVVDDLAEWSAYMDAEELSSFLSIVRHGPRVKVWTIASVDSECAARLDERLVNAFRTRLVGAVSDPETAEYMAGAPDSFADEIAPGYQFAALFGEEWIRFWILSES